MPAIVVLGAQWGDEGKGKATDLLATTESIDYVVRTSGGHNAGHTIVVTARSSPRTCCPSGILTPGCTAVIGNGVVVSPEALFRELDALAARGVDVSRLVVSANAHVIASYHTTIDKVTERFLGKNKVGTTGRGIGPAYADKVARVGIRIADLFDEKILREKVEASLDLKNQLLAKVYNRRAVDVDAVVEELPGVRRAAAADGRRHLPAAQPTRSTAARRCSSRAPRPRCSTSTTAPTRSSRRPTPVAGGVCTGAGVGPTRIDRVIGVIKAYTTRVGSGPFPTELFDEDGEKLWKIGGEVGVSTGRDRRCGWYDAVVARYASRVNGLTDLFLTKLDVLSSWERVPVCVAYDVDGVAARRDADDADRVPPRQAGLRAPRRLVGGHLRLPLRSTTCRPTPRPTSARSRRCRAPASGASASAPAASRRSSYRPEPTCGLRSAHDHVRSRPSTG